MTRDFTSATLASSENNSRDSVNFCAFSCPPFTSKVKMEAAPFGKYCYTDPADGLLPEMDGLLFLPVDGSSGILQPSEHFPHDVLHEETVSPVPAEAGKSLNGEMVAPLISHQSSTDLHYISDVSACFAEYNTMVRWVWFCDSRELVVLSPVKFPPSTITPPITLPCPPMNLVAECTTISAPCSSGRSRNGVANVLSTISGIPFS